MEESHGNPITSIDQQERHTIHKSLLQINRQMFCFKEQLVLISKEVI